MKEIQVLISQYDQFKSTNTKLALATVVNVEGSSYRRTGARMLITEKGEWFGGVSGGCLEGDLLRKAKHCIQKEKHTIVRYDTTQDDAYQIGVGLGCQGIIDILLIPLQSNQINNPLEVLKQALNQRKPKLYISCLKNETNIPLEVGNLFSFSGIESIPEKKISKKIQEQLLKDVSNCLENQKSKIVNYKDNALSLFLEVILPPIHLVIVGSNYDIYPMVDLAYCLGWKTTIIAKPIKIRKETLKVATVFPPNKTNLEQLSVDAFTVAVLMAHDYKTDLKFLQFFVETNVAYIGLLGPKKRGNKLLEQLESKGQQLTSILKDKIHSPTGLDIGANSPEEIALSILAEIRAFMSARPGSPLKGRKGRIHE